MNRNAEFDLPLSLLREEIAGSDLLPGAYARYRPLVADALCFFLQRLSPSRLRGIFTEQLRLPPSVSTAERVVALLSHLPALHKLGQVVARDRRLSHSFRHRLQALESLPAQVSLRNVVRLIHRECPGWQKAGIQLAPQPLAEGSVAVIMPFTWHEGNRPAREGVFKLLKPGIRGRLEQDLEILSALAGFLDEDCAKYRLPALDYRETFETIRELLFHEIRFEEEQRNLAEAAGLYSPAGSVVVPELFPFCSAHLTAMERLRGKPIPVGGHLPGRVPVGTAAQTIVRALVAEPIFSARNAALFHADPHAGNLLLLPSARVGVLDWSLTGRLSRPDREALVQLLLAALSLDGTRMEQILAGLAQPQRLRPQARQILEASLGAVQRGTFPAMTWLIALLDKLVLEAGMRLDANLLLFRKALLTLEGVLADVLGSDEQAAQALLDTILTASLLQHWAVEWPARFLVPMNVRSPTTHLSTADVLSLLWSGPAALARWWRRGVGAGGACGA